MGFIWLTGHASSVALGYLQKDWDRRVSGGRRISDRREEAPHQDRSELPRPKTMTNARPKTDETRSASPRRVKMIVAIKLYSQIIGRITFASFAERRSSISNSAARIGLR